MGLPQIPMVDREQAINDMIEALALQEAAIASLIMAESAKIDALVQAGIPTAATIQEVDSFQASVSTVLQFAADKGQAISSKLELLRNMIGEKRQEPTP